MKVIIKKILKSALIPTKATEGSAGYDLFAVEDVYIPSKETATVGTGLSMEIPKGWRGDIYTRSSMALRGMVVANSPGKIDSDYRGEIKVILHNNYPLGVGAIKAGDKIAQFEIVPTHDIEFEESNTLTDTERGDGGFGSTGQ